MGTLNLFRLSARISTLLALASLLRVSELTSINRRTIILNEEEAMCFLSRPGKAQHLGPLQSVSILRCHDKEICPVAGLEYYVIVTDPARNFSDGDEVLVTMTAPHRPASSSTVARWIKSYAGWSGVNIDVFSTHWIREASASKAVVSGVPIDSILKATD